MKLTVLGNNGPYPKAGGACSGFLLDSGESKVVLDFGSGVLSRLQQFIDIEDITAIILSHLHGDHIGDISVLRYAADIKLMKGRMEKPIKIYAPSEPAEEFERLKYKKALEVIAINPAEMLLIGDLRISFREMVHSYKNYAVCVEKSLRRFVYSGDTCMNDGIIEFARNADLFLCEAGLLERDDKCIRAMHLTAREAAQIAEDAGAKRLLLTHFLPGTNPEHYINEATSVYNGIMELAGENKSYFI
ncbi:MAG TPA: MBL fold metallo-hydrolase [Clostridia bacterium]|nr:MBL fold metallo-hydrolase [Clostridia bacterium]